MKHALPSMLVGALALASSATAFWRMPCRSRTGLARIDPLVYPGEISSHVHAIHGGGNFGMEVTYEDLVAGPHNCTSCEVTQDMSVYWTPAMYFLFANGTAEVVPQVGGMLAYYQALLENVTAFQEGFQMIAGNADVRNFTGPFPDTPLSFWPTDSTNEQFFLQQRAIGFNCLNYDITPEPSLYRHQFPTKEYMDANCKDGVRIELAFPSCSNGSLDSADHKSHVAYPSLVKEGNCPDGFDTHMPFLFFETIWATNAYSQEDGQFLLSYGDPVGTGYHGDFIMGWESAAFLTAALNDCTNLSGLIQDCPLFNIQSDAVAAQCTFPVPEELANDNPTGPRDGLPVDVPIQAGPGHATPYPIAGQSGIATTSAPPVPSAALSSFYAGPTLSYSAADPSLTSSALGGIVVAEYSPGAHPPSADAVLGAGTTASAAQSPITSAPSASDYASAPDIVTTNYMTQGNEVIEMVLEEVLVTVTATPSPSGESKRRRHFEHHLHDVRT